MGRTALAKTVTSIEEEGEGEGEEDDEEEEGEEGELTIEQYSPLPSQRTHG